jgi:hypothetical protein
VHRRQYRRSDDGIGDRRGCEIRIGKSPDCMIKVKNILKDSGYQIVSVVVMVWC